MDTSMRQIQQMRRELSDMETGLVVSIQTKCENLIRLLLKEEGVVEGHSFVDNEIKDLSSTLSHGIISMMERLNFVD